MVQSSCLRAPIVFGHDRLRVSGDVEALCVSPDGRLLAVGSGFGDEAGLWALPGLERVGRVSEATGSFAFSPAGDVLWLAYAHTHVWDFARGRVDWFARSENVGAPIALSPDGARLVGARPPGDREEIVLLDARSGRLSWSVPTAGPQVSSIAFTPDGAWIVVGETDGARILEAETGRTLERLDSPAGRLRWISVSPRDGTIVVGAEGSKSIDVLDRGGSRTLVVQLPFDLERLALDPQGHRLAALGDAGETAVVELSDGAVRAVPMARPVSGGQAVALAGPLLAVSDFRSVVLFDLEAGEPIAEPPAHRDRVSAVAVGPDGSWIATAGGFDGTVRVWSTTDGAHLCAFEGHGNLIDAIAVSRDGRLVASACADGDLRIFEVARRQGAPALEVPDAHGHHDVCGVGFLPDGRIVTLGDDAAIMVWEQGTGRRLAQVGSTGFTGVPRLLAVRGDGRWVAASGSEREVVVVEVDSGREVLRKHGCGQVLAFADHAPWLAVREEDATVILALPGGEVVRRWQDVIAVSGAFDLGGRLALARSSEPPIVLDPARDADGVVPPGVVLPATAVAFAPDGRFALGLKDGRAMLVEVPQEPLTARERDAWLRQRRADDARALLSSLAVPRASAGYRDSIADIHLQDGGLGLVVTRGDAAVRVVALVADEATTELRLTVHAAGASPAPAAAPVPAPATFAARMARWIRRRLGRPESQDVRAAVPWLATLPGIQRARTARSEHAEGALEVTVVLDQLPTSAELLAWVDGCVAHAASTRR